MTNQEYLEAYRQARKIYPDLTKEAMTRLRQIYINASESVANQIRVAELAGRSQLTIDSLKKIEQELRIAAEKIRQAVQSSVINLSSEGVGLQSNINYSYITDLFHDVDKITQLGISNMLVGVDTTVISSIINRMYTDGYSFSDRVWAIGEAYQSTIKDIISAGLAQGRDVVKIARDLEVYLKGGKISLVQRYGELLRDTKEFTSRIGNSVDSRALRLLMSELYASLQEAALWHGKINPACTGMYDWVMENGRQDWNCVCPEYAEKQYKYEDVPAYPHPHCFAEGTEVYTKRGWIDFKNVLLNDDFLSYDIENKKYEFVKAIQKQEFKIDDYLYRIKSKNFNLLITDKHSNLIIDNNKKFRFIKTDELFKNPSQYKIPRCFNTWKGKKIKQIKIGDHFIDSKLYCEFMGYYLSEGNVTKYTGYGKKFGKITQFKKDNIEKMEICLKQIPFSKLSRTKEGFYFKENSILEDLYKYGKSYEKYIPSIIKTLSKDLIKIFLDAYILGDGSRRKERICKLKNIKAKEEIYISTSSKRMSDDLGELILKCGGYPSYNIVEPKFIKHKNGIYKSKYNTYTIRWNNKLNSKFHGKEKKGLQITKEKYSGFVYDVTLEKYHILWIRYNGKTCFSGNCRCEIRPVLMDHNTFMSNLQTWVNGGSVGYLDNWYNEFYLPYQMSY